MSTISFHHSGSIGQKQHEERTLGLLKGHRKVHQCLQLTGLGGTLEAAEQWVVNVGRKPGSNATGYCPPTITPMAAPSFSDMRCGSTGAQGRAQPEHQHQPGNQSARSNKQKCNEW